VLLPRPAGRGADLIRLLAADGIEVLHHPFVELLPEVGDDLRQALTDLADGAFPWLVVTSPAAVGALRSTPEAAIDPGLIPRSTGVAAVGAGTAHALLAAGIQVDLVAEGSGGAALVDAFPPAPQRGARVLFPASAAASPTVREGLTAKGYAVDQVVAYRPQPVTPEEDVLADLREGRFDAIVLTSGMITRTVAGVGIHPSTRVVTIGHPTTRAAREAGLEVALMAHHPDDASLAEAVRAVLADPATPCPAHSTDPSTPSDPSDPSDQSD
jgi:uroporphyrinogen-III synthase